MIGWSLRTLTAMTVIAMPVWSSQGPVDGVAEVHVDERCRIVTQDRDSATGKYSRPQYRQDADICRIQGEAKSKHWEGSIEGGIVKRTQVRIIERTFVLHDPTDAPVTFYVEELVPEGWQVDSTPQPWVIEDHIATFRVIAKPGETIKLHVGIRH